MCLRVCPQSDLYDFLKLKTLGVHALEPPTARTTPAVIVTRPDEREQASTLHLRF